MDIKAHSKTYRVSFEKDFDFIGKLAATEQSFWVIDKKVYELYKDRLIGHIPSEAIMLIEAKEENKVIETALSICEKMTEFPGKRNITLISMGGGIIQDITGFAANILYRGIKWVFIPTTLLASCDSCIGSKTSLNYKKFKNLLGTFYPPDELHICPAFFSTLSQIDFMSGLGEVVKFNVMAGNRDLVKLRQDLPDILQKDEHKMEEYVRKSLEFKKAFIEADEYDRGVRIHLNFAHTFGHAFESVTDYAIPHGTAVAMGTMVADEISYRRGWLGEHLKNDIQDLLLQILPIPLLEEKNGFQLSSLSDMDAIMNAIRKDKKQVDRNYTAVLFQNDDLELRIVHDLERSEVEKAVEELMVLLRDAFSHENMKTK